MSSHLKLVENNSHLKNDVEQLSGEAEGYKLLAYVLTTPAVFGTPSPRIDIKTPHPRLHYHLALLILIQYYFNTLQ